MFQTSGNRYVPVFNVPPTVTAIFAVFVIVHLYRLALGQAAEMEFLLRFAFIPARYAALQHSFQVYFPGGMPAAVWTFFTYALVHADWAHLLMNSVWMLAFGSVAARRLGPARFVAYSLTCAVAGALVMLAVYWGEMVPVIGASAAVSGQLAATCRLLYGGGSTAAPASVVAVMLDPRALKFLGVWVAINLLISLGSFEFVGDSATIAWEAHLGGFAAGFVLFGLFDRVGRT